MISEELKLYFDKADNFKVMETDQQSIVQYSMMEGKEKDRLFIKDHMLMFVLRGNQGIVTPNYFYKLEAGEAIFVKKGSIIVCEKLKYGNTLECILVFLTDEFLSEFISQHRQLIAPSELLDVNSMGAYQFYLDKWMDGYITSVSSYFQLTPTPVSELLKHKFEELLILLVTGQERSYFMSFLRECLVEENSSIDVVINANVYRSLNVDHLAYLSNLSLSQFKREFKKKYNDSPANWLRNKRLERSSKLLLTTNKNINEICYESGFNNASHFCQLFHKQYQISPLKYRQKMTA
ncbi:helix-turn-helix domain-containing protein [Flavivirga jejuensis]|uniref:Helix-turn-helix transcriptional regulator n=1 Tax=Flavivirga jejuensis TaxID=870487 RepID=A0ABT8WKG9_9FLAO|nr:helix-turn-helix transcriptional regulator [Flavivirga jejuensis]MDO5973651.1 helix-turn-helix transcriptional regulator [Flavivirga jejuensis]